MSWPTVPFDTKLPPLSDDDLVPGGWEMLRAAFESDLEVDVAIADWIYRRVRQRENRCRRRRRRMAQRLGR